MQMLLMTGIAGYGGQYFTNLGLQRETAATVSSCWTGDVGSCACASLSNIASKLSCRITYVGHACYVDSDCLDLYL